MKTKGYTLETFLYLLALALALLVRFASLGHVPLSDAEARLALQALALARGEPALLAAQPGYLVPTALLFALFQPTDWLARFWPALAGSLLAIAPLFYRRWMGRWPALLLAFALALDPGLVSIVRSAGGMSLAISGLALAVGCALSGRALLAGVFAGLALLGGIAFWPGALALALAVLAAWLLLPRLQSLEAGQPAPTASMRMPAILVATALVAAGFLLVQSGYLFLSVGVWLAAWYAGRSGVEDEPGFRWPVPGFDGRLALLALLLTVLVAGTGFWRVPAGLSALGGGLPAYAQSYSDFSGVSALRMLVALVIYQPLALILGVWRIVANLFRRSRVDAFLSIAWFFALGLAVLPAGRQVADLGWSLLPLWALAARQAWALLPRLDTESRFPALAQMVVQFVLLVFVFQDLLALNNDINSMIENPQLRLVRIIGALVLMVLSGLMLGVGWNWRAAGRGLVLGFGLALVLYSVSALAASSGALRAQPTDELYRPGPAPLDARLLAETVHDLGLYAHGNGSLLDVTLVGVPSPSLEWALRGEERVDSAEVLPAGVLPAVVITPARVQLAAADAYRGQDFYWVQQPAWESLTPRQWINWWFYRRTPQPLPDLILWARGDLFFGGAGTTPMQP